MPEPIKSMKAKPMKMRDAGSRMRPEMAKRKMQMSKPKLPDEGLDDVSFGHFPKSPPDNGNGGTSGSGVRNKKPSPKPTPALAVAEAKMTSAQKRKDTRLKLSLIHI